MLVKIRSYGIGVCPKVRARRRENRDTHTEKKAMCRGRERLE